MVPGCWGCCLGGMVCHHRIDPVLGREDESPRVARPKRDLTAETTGTRHRRRGGEFGHLRGQKTLEVLAAHGPILRRCCLRWCRRRHHSRLGRRAELILQPNALVPRLTSLLQGLGVELAELLDLLQGGVGLRLGGVEDSRGGSAALLEPCDLGALGGRGTLKGLYGRLGGPEIVQEGGGGANIATLPRNTGRGESEGLGGTGSWSISKPLAATLTLIPPLPGARSLGAEAKPRSAWGALLTVLWITDSRFPLVVLSWELSRASLTRSFLFSYHTVLYLEVGAVLSRCAGRGLGDQGGQGAARRRLTHSSYGAAPLRGSRRCGGCCGGLCGPAARR